MRTTVALEPDLVRKIKALAYRRKLSFKQALNEVIRRGLTSADRQDPQPRYTLDPHPSGLCPGVEQGKLNQRFDQLEVEDFLTKVQR